MVRAVTKDQCTTVTSQEPDMLTPTKVSERKGLEFLEEQFKYLQAKTEQKRSVIISFPVIVYYTHMN